MKAGKVLSVMCVFLFAVILAACGGRATEPMAPTETPTVEEVTPEPTELQAEPTPAATPEPTAAPPETEAPDMVTYTTADLPDAGLTLEVPESWVRLEPDAVWAPAVTEAPAAMIHPRIGVKMVELEPPAEAEAFLLPQPAQILDSQPVESSLGTGRSFVLEVYGLTDEGDDEQGDVISVERHVLISVMVGDRRIAYDIYGAAASPEELSGLDAVVSHMVQTAVAMPMSMPAQGGQANLDIPAVMQAKARLAQHLDVSETEITAVSAEFVEWPDACLGVSEPGQMCATVITPGYRIILETGGQQYEVHTDRNGSAVAIVSR